MADMSSESSKDDKEKKKNILEEKSKEELVNLVKKYLSLLQKAKNKSDALSERCSILEKEKNVAIEEQQAMEKDFLSKIAELQSCISELSAEKEKKADYENEILELKSKLQELSAEVSKTPTLRENEEQLQCLQLQLQSLKASCQCIQDENAKLSLLNKDLLHENKLLKDEKNDLSQSLANKMEEFSSTLSERNDIYIKYENCLKENKNYVKDIESLKADLKTNNDNDTSPLIQEIEDLREKNKMYQKHFQHLEEGDFSPLITDLENLRSINASIEAELKECKDRQTAYPNSKNYMPSTDELDENFVRNLPEVKRLESELSMCRAEKRELVQQIKFLSSLSELGDYRAGIESALLHGATTEGLLSSSEDLKYHACKPLPIPADTENAVCMPGVGVVDIHSSIHNVAGLEYGLLEGGDISGFIIPNDESMNINILPGSSASFSSQESVPNDKILFLEAETNSLRKQLDEYSSLFNDTLEENKILKTRLEEFQSKVLVDHETSTEYEFSQKEDIALKNEESGEKHAQEVSNLTELYARLYKEIILIFQKASLIGNKDLQCAESEEDPVFLLHAVVQIYANQVNELEKQLNSFNVQLETLIIGIKQGVRQKNSAVSHQAENKPEENLSLLKVLLDDLVMRSNNYVSKARSLETFLLSEKKELQDELAQIKELNQFLEVENRELNSELERLKQYLNDVENANDQQYSEEIYQRVPELYSIEESNEVDEKTDDNSCSLDADNIVTETSDFTNQTSYETDDSATQVGLDLNENSSKIMLEIEEKTRNLSDNAKIIEQLSKENITLNNSVKEKSDLVETIHCQMDSLLEKVEELTDELKHKENELKHSKTDIKTIEEKIEIIKQQHISVLKIAHDSLLELKLQTRDINTDMKSFTVSMQEMITCITDHILHIKACNNEQKLSEIKLWINQLNDEFKPYINILDSSKLRHSISDPDTIQFGDALCAVEDDCLNNLKNNCASVVKNLDIYRLQVVPILENTVAKLEQKLSEKVSERSSAEAEKMPDEACKEESDEVLKNQLAEAETKMGKFKQIALKLKKDLTQMKEQFSDVSSEKEKLEKQKATLVGDLKKLSEEQCKYVQNYQTLQNEFDKLQDEYEAQQITLKKLEDDFSSKLRELTSSKEQIIELQSEIKSSKQSLDLSLNRKKDLELKCAEFESKVIILESQISEKAQKINSLESEVAKHLKDVSAACSENKNLRDQLELAQKGKKKSLIDLEMADYAKSIFGLENQVQLKDDEINELQKELKSFKDRYECLLEEIRSTETLKETESKRADNLKDILEKTKTELSLAKEHESKLMSKAATLEVQLEILNQEKEENKLQLSESSAQIQHLHDVLKTSSENHQRIIKSFEQKVSNQKQEILLAHKEVESVKQEFENYKIRVHSVLKQQKTVTSNLNAVDDDLKEKLENMNDKLKLQVKDLSEKLTALNLEHETLQEEHEVLLQRYNKVIDEQESKVKEWQERLDEVNAEKARLSATQEEITSQHLLQNEMLVATYKKQIKIMSDEHKHIVSDLQKQLDAADIEIARLQRDQQKQQGLPLTPLPHDSSPFDIMSQERQEGEGSESTDEITTPIRHLSLATIPTSGFLPFEKLIQSSVEPGTPASYVSVQDSEKLSADLTTANKKIDHLSELLNESESTNMRLSEQVRLLKDEVRRIENNKEREKHGENLEYLKNIFIKFASLQPGSEKAMLVPVLTTMLKLNLDEQQQLKSVAGDLGSDDSASAGWSSYLHRWSGLS